MLLHSVTLQELKTALDNAEKDKEVGIIVYRVLEIEHFVQVEI